jgi:hypothetical protein
MSKPDGKPERRTVIGGRHGSPSVTIALPFARITTTDGEVRDEVAELAVLVSRLAEGAARGDRDMLALVRDAADELAARVSRE